MYFIVNTTKQSLSISDLKLVLGPRQGIDLDVKYSREQVEKSNGLKTLISKGMLSVKTKTEPSVESRFIQEVHTHNHNEFDAEKMKQEILEGLKDVLAENLKPAKVESQVQPQQSSNIDMAELAKMITSMMPQTQQVSSNNERIIDDEDIKVDEGVLADIHSRTVNKIVESVQSGEINCDSSTTKNDIDDNIDELENLLG